MIDLTIAWSKRISATLPQLASSAMLQDLPEVDDCGRLRLIRSHISAGAFRASGEDMVTENAARVALMQQGEQLVDGRLEQVKGRLSSVRQTAITNELMNVITGFEALKNNHPSLPECHIPDSDSYAR